MQTFYVQSYGAIYFDYKLACPIRSSNGNYEYADKVSEMISAEYQPEKLGIIEKLVDIR